MDQFWAQAEPKYENLILWIFENRVSLLVSFVFGFHGGFGSSFCYAIWTLNLWAEKK